MCRGGGIGPWQDLTLVSLCGIAVVSHIEMLLHHPVSASYIWGTGNFTSTLNVEALSHQPKVNIDTMGPNLIIPQFIQWAHLHD